MIVPSTGTSTTRLGAFLGALLAAVFGDRTSEFAFLVVVRFLAFLRVGLALALRRFELFLRLATSFFAMAISCELAAGGPNLAKPSQLR